ncbi:hypothetical protein JRO89_XS15G0074000 [Xanthoceras sorbifolium]|uniref:N-acetyltransferase domain-containing protein n=1 Tax=Xanthoceras sorbifolium TaxID=99658 RepID=A0ABQ8H182_9ROSI|nr:hypothetical protein JRO89_XS15G0074000 [Xanthoceras sorbifolium]
MGYGDLIIRSYDAQIDRFGVEDLERRCEVTELGDELVGVIQGSIKRVTVHKPTEDLAKVGYVLGLRVAPVHRRKGIGSSLVRKLEEWFISNDVEGGKERDRDQISNTSK